MSERLLAVSRIIGGIYKVCICSKDHRRQAFTTSVIGVVDTVCRQTKQGNRTHGHPTIRGVYRADKGSENCSLSSLRIAVQHCSRSSISEVFCMSDKLHSEDCT